MVEVTKHNFQELFSCVEKSIRESCFIAIDTEFTGLDLGSTNELSLFDSTEIRYQKLKNRASSILPCQVGLSMFRKSETENKYLVETYIFFIRPYLCGSIDRRFMCQASSLDFLCKYDFDFNKFIKEGIPYLSEEEEAQVWKEIKEKTIGFSHEKMRELKSRRDIDLLINNTLLNSFLSGKNHLPLRKQESETNRLELEKDKTCHEYFLINELRNRYPTLKVYLENEKIIVEKLPDKELNKLFPNAKIEEESLVDYYLGFTKVFRMLKLSNKPIVGHNLLMDLLLFYHNFHKSLPKTYKEFKKELHSLFPVIFDTRHMWLFVKKVAKLKEVPRQCGLFELFEMFKNPNDSLTVLFSPEFEHTNCDKYRSEEFPHESGYDSYVTGWVFLKICHVLALNKITNPVLIQPQTFKQHLKAAYPFQNKITLPRSMIRYINLSEEDPKPTESQFLYISVRNKRKTLYHTELSRLFGKYGMIEFKLNKSKKEAVLAIGHWRCFREILKDFQNDPDILVTEYNFFRHSFFARSALWLTVLGAGAIAAICTAKFLSQS